MAGAGKAVGDLPALSYDRNGMATVTVAVMTTAGGTARGDRTLGADPLLRYLALLEPVLAPATPTRDAAE